MRVLLALTLLVAGALAGGKEKREMEMWMKMKAMEGCFGKIQLRLRKRRI